MPEYLYRGVSVEGVARQFDLIYAFSVFTHLSEKTMMVAPSAIRQKIKPDGLFVLTIRPSEYRDRHPLPLDSKQHSEILSRHNLRGFAFVPHDAGLPVDGEATYGDASRSLDYIRQQWPSWQICGYDHNVQDAQQIIVFLRPSRTSRPTTSAARTVACQVVSENQFCSEMEPS